MPDSGHRPANLPSAEETEGLLARLAQARLAQARADLDPATDPAEPDPADRGSADRGSTDRDQSDRARIDRDSEGGRLRRRRGRSRFRLRWLLLPLVLLLLLGLSAAGLLAGGLDRTQATAPATPTESSVVLEPTPTVSAAPVPTPRPVLAWPGSSTGLPTGLAAAGPGVTEPGEEVTVTPGEGISLEVYERVLLPAGTAAARLVAPDLAAVPTLRLARPVWVRDLEVTTDGLPARALWQGNSWTIRSSVPGRAYRSFTARYRLANAVLLQEPAAAGRAQLLVTPLFAGGAHSAGVPVLARADDRVTISNATCPAAGPCSAPAGRSVAGLLPALGTAGVVLLQADRLQLH